ncbi:solute carrier family 46 member 3-like isoform X1 [Haliotis rubra]|uniref:solute carrier family 46 member 3-like isoform X1 n=1 Tax=Haliotis rubra TaxID=36100 RepID=UPI001EE4EC05|nr:solute carrier family 46 member 3-like isoform X1 [Haliotis rubra]XP_046556692.1 solute carrier family 46 member 3-like isoform X1 [Haliotis rubra]XP_046556693.1 solute carrier family 46 member 3-like isoform X1 [Haliotis rubra]XP_046556694.1 solute carrier family 46 member 3-like isoform X1 [Haliotis rubra]XP_046556695.1 solute carrier family 46 member 3-like isoform X1 [Haliotis rubra]
MDREETSPLLPEKHKSRVVRSVPFLWSAIACAVVSFLVALANVSLSPIISQYVHARLLDGYNTTTSDEGSSACEVNTSSTTDDPLVKVQQETSNFLLLLAVVNNVPAIFVNVILGSTSDYLGRKMLFFIPSVGFFLRYVFCVVIMALEMDYKYFYIAYVLDGFGGSFGAFLVASFAYTADITSNGRGRILATSALEVCVALAACAGMLITGFFIPLVGYLNLNIIMTCTVFLAAVIILFLPETMDSRTKQPWSPITHFKKVFGFYFFKKGTKTGAYRIMLLIFLFAVFSVVGRVGIETLYALNRPFCWNSVQVGYFGALRIGLSNVGSLIAIKFLQRHFRDQTIALLGAVDAALACVLEGLATSGWMLYLVPVVGIVSATTIPVIRGSMSRMTSQTEQGAVFAGIGVVETVMNLISQVAYTSVYSATVGSLKGTVFFLMAGLSGVTTVLVIIWMVITPRFEHLYTLHVSPNESMKSKGNDSHSENTNM